MCWPLWCQTCSFVKAVNQFMFVTRHEGASLNMSKTPSSNLNLFRDEVTRKILKSKIELNLDWATLAEQLNRSKEWTVAACLGQMKFNKEQAEIVQKYFDLNDEHTAWLQITPYKNNSLTFGIPTDPLLYRLHEVSNLIVTIHMNRK